MNKPRSITILSAAAVLASSLQIAHAEDEAATATLDYDATVTNTTTGESVSRTRDTVVTGSDSGATWTRKDSVNGASRGANATTSGAVVQNDDGSVSYQKDRTVTNRAGESVTGSTSVDVARDDDGSVTVDRQKDVQGSGGRSFSAGQQGELTRNEDGSGSFNRSATATATNADGETRSANAERNAGWKPNEEGGRDFEGSWGASTSEGRAAGGELRGRTTRDGNGNASFEGTRERFSNRGSSQLERSGRRSVDESGAVTRERSRRAARF